MKQSYLLAETFFIFIVVILPQNRKSILHVWLLRVTFCLQMATLFMR